MSLKQVFAPHLGRSVKFGRIPSKIVRPQLKMAHYVCEALPDPPPAKDYSTGAMDSLSRIFLNDQLGDCVIAGGYHLAGIETGNAGRIFVPTDAQLVHDYHAIGGYVPGDPSTDNGCEIQVALNYWARRGFANGTKLIGSLSVDASNAKEWRQALWLFEGSLLGICLPDAWVKDMPQASGFTWDAAGAPDPENGHCIVGAGYDERGMKIGTWGLLGSLTDRALAQYATASGRGELHIALSPDQIAKGEDKAPNGLAWADLKRDFEMFNSI